MSSEKKFAWFILLSIIYMAVVVGAVTSLQCFKVIDEFEASTLLSASVIFPLIGYGLYWSIKTIRRK